MARKKPPAGSSGAFHPLSATFPLLSVLAADYSVLWLFTQFQHSCKLLAGRAPAWAVLGRVPSGVACTRCTCGGCLSVLADVGADGRETSPREEGKGFPLIYFCLLIIERRRRSGILLLGSHTPPPPNKHGICSGFGLAVGLFCVVGYRDKTAVPASFPFHVPRLPGLRGGCLEALLGWLTCARR